jgi:SAM-dependent methyltransferase
MRVVRADALGLPFSVGTFDLVWSWGVLHHTGDIERAVQEVRRVLKPGGEARLMLYHRPSWVAIAAWGRWALLRGRPWQSLRRVVAEHVESPGTIALTTREIRQLMADFRDLETRVVGTYWDRRFVPILGRLAGPRLGWFALIKAWKP